MKKIYLFVAVLLMAVLSAFQPANAAIHFTSPTPMGPLFRSMTFYASDLDLLQQGSGPELFQLVFDSDTPLSAPKLHARLLNGQGSELAFGILNLTPGRNWNVSQQSISSSHGSWNRGAGLTGALENQVLRTGMIPMDTYTYWFALYENNTPLDSTYYTFTVLGNGFLNLSFPENDPNGNNPVLSTLPFFVWNSSQSTFTIRIAEVHSGETPDGALSARANCEESVSSNSFQYPSVGVVPLEPGKYYAWQVKTQLTTSHGSVPITSEVRVFRIAPVVTPEGQQLLTALSQLLTHGNGPQYLQEIRQGQLSGEVFLNGQLITVQQLFSMLAAFNSQQYNIISITKDGQH